MSKEEENFDFIPHVENGKKDIEKILATFFQSIQTKLNHLNEPRQSNLTFPNQNVTIKIETIEDHPLTENITSSRSKIEMICSRFVKRRWRCRRCKKKFKTISQLNAHKLKFHKYSTNISKVRETIEKEQEQPIKAINVPVGQSLKDTIFEKMSFKNESIRSKQREAFAEIVAQLKILKEEKLKKMELEPPKKPDLFECTICGKKFKKLHNLNRHTRNHKEEKPFTCDHCDKKFKHKSTLITHKQIHTGEKPYQCDQCGKTYAQFANLYNHKKYHADVRPYGCDQCEKRFVGLTLLKAHQRVHCVGEKVENRFKCPICMKTFFRKSSLNSHSLIHTRRDKPYQCDQCGLRYVNKSSLTVHKRNHTGEKFNVINVNLNVRHHLY